MSHLIPGVSIEPQTVLHMAHLAPTYLKHIVDNTQPFCASYQEQSKALGVYLKGPLLQLANRFVEGDLCGQGPVTSNADNNILGLIAAGSILPLVGAAIALRSEKIRAALSWNSKD